MYELPFVYVREAGIDSLARGLESIRAKMSEQLVAAGVRLPDRRAKGGRRKASAA